MIFANFCVACVAGGKDKKHNKIDKTKFSKTKSKTQQLKK